MEKVDCIVVGGGLAGLSAAYGLASAGVEVMVLERGDYAGAKNVTGGRLYTSVLGDVYPELWEEAAAEGGPFERPVVREAVTVLGDGAATTVELRSDRLAAPSPQSHTLLRAKFDQWLAEKATDKGATIVTGMKADELLLEGGGASGGGATGGGAAAATSRPKVIGIRAGDDEVGADVTIVAEGALGLLASGAGLREQPRAADHALGFKEVVELPSQTIEDRFRVAEGEGAAHLFLGTVTRGMTGGGFLYTNKESLSLGIVVSMEQMRAREDELESWQLLDEFRKLPAVAPLVAGGTVAEYSAHGIPEGGIEQVPRLFGDGYLLAGDAAGLSLNALVTVRGMDFAIASGHSAAQAVLTARKADDYSAAMLAAYDRLLHRSFVLPDMAAARDYPRIIENRRLFTQYPDLLVRQVEALFTVGPGPSPRLLPRLWRGKREIVFDPATWRDLWSMRRL